MPAQDKIEQLQAQLGYVFTDVTGLKLALTHRSAAGLHNERLEFLGDAVLELVVTHRLYHQYPGVDEGRLSRFRAQLVRKESLASKARELGVGRHLILSVRLALNLCQSIGIIERRFRLWKTSRKAQRRLN